MNRKTSQGTHDAQAQKQGLGFRDASFGPLAYSREVFHRFRDMAAPHPKFHISLQRNPVALESTLNPKLGPNPYIYTLKPKP